MKMMDYIPEYEAQTGEKVSPLVARFAEQLDIVGRKFEAKGCEDAAKGLPVPSDDAFREWSKQLLQDKIEFLEELVGLLRLYYMDGYEAVRKPRETEVSA